MLLLTLIQVVVFGLLAGPGVLLAVAAARTSDNAGLATGVVLAILGGLLALAALLFVATRWCFATSVLAVERIGIGAALRRSWRNGSPTCGTCGTARSAGCSLRSQSEWSARSSRCRSPCCSGWVEP